MHKSMDVNSRQVMAANILMGQGYDVIEIGRAFEKVKKNKHSLRHYSRYISEENRDVKKLLKHNRVTQSSIDGCLVAVKIRGSIKFGFSVIHPNDLKDGSCSIPKKVTGLVAAAKAYLSPNDTIPMKFSTMFTDRYSDGTKEVNHHFLERCANYFKVKSISANVTKEITKKVNGKSRKVGYGTDRVVLKFDEVEK